MRWLQRGNGLHRDVAHALGQQCGKGLVPLWFELGEALQFDWTDDAMVIDGVLDSSQIAHLKLCTSRAFWLVAYPSQARKMLIDPG